MIDTFKAENHVNDDGVPTGGYARGTGMSIDWQSGPLGRGEDRAQPNGAFVETVIAAARQRIEHYQEAAGGRFACGENQLAIHHLNSALAILNERTKRREAAQTEGTHEGN